ncbi:hypothetical protein MMG00_12050 [Ignatzschineria rhizosphaerae]|uniref:Uncharacterized protein n=1 Tax=Ignatzschineria rhizosphaerae TaxID=2923279 RepID=A0ABY3X4E9_9GAMM|nr:hypothetical protein [Ignatzschineria rhizosphaerae]UNM95917.1 hypothetical protein MMG00_12050 [Ignatzschineria rhizosphaerae]
MSTEIQNYRKKDLHKTLRYFAYSVADRSYDILSNGLRYSINLHAFLECFVEHDDNEFKSSFLDNNSNNIFLLKTESPNVFYFIKTSDGEMIHSIQTKNLEIKDIESQLSDGEKIGYSSYVSFHDGFLGFISSLNAPNISDFTLFVNKLLFKKDILLELIVTPMQIDLHQSEVDDLSFIGTGSVEISAKNNLANALGNLLFNSGFNNTNVGKIKIEFIPERGTSIKDEYLALLKSALDSDSEDPSSSGFIDGRIRARKDLESRSMDYYINSQANLTDRIKITTSKTIGVIINEKIENNSELKERVLSYKQELTYNENQQSRSVQVDIFNKYCDAGGWVITSNCI